MTWRAYLEPRDTRAAALASSGALVTASVIALGYELSAPQLRHHPWWCALEPRADGRPAVS